MAIRTIEVICNPCIRCEKVIKNIQKLIKAMELQKGIKIPYEFKHTPHIRDISKYSLNASQTPAIIINGNAELAGHFEPTNIKTKLEQIFRGS